MRREQTRGRWRLRAERDLAHGLGEVRRLASVLGFSNSIRDQTCQLFRSVQNEDLLQGKPIEAIAAASMYGAHRYSSLSWLVDDVSEVARVAESRITDAHRTPSEALGLPAESTLPGMFVPQLASDLEYLDETRQRIRTLTEQAEERGVMTDARPVGFTTAYLYKVDREGRRWLTQHDVAESGNVAPATVRTHRGTLDELTVQTDHIGSEGAPSSQ